MKPISLPAIGRLPGRALLCSLGLWALGHLAQTAPAPQAFPIGSFQEQLRAPTRLATDTQGRIYIADPSAGRVVVLNATGQITAVRTNPAGPLGIAVDAQGRIHLGERQRGRVAVYDSQWNQVSQLGQGDGEFGLPNYITIDNASTPPTVYVTDSPAHVVKIYRNGTLVTSFGGRGSTAGKFNFPAGLCINPAGELLVADQNNDRVQVFDLNGVFKRSFTLRPPGITGRSGRAQGITTDSMGRIYVADSFQGLVKAFDSNGAFLSFVGDFGTAMGQLRTPAAVLVDGQNLLYVASANNGRIEIFGLDLSVAASQTPAGDVEIRWQAPGYLLQSAPSPLGSWTTLPSATSPYVIPKSTVLTTPTQFFRLQKGP